MCSNDIFMLLLNCVSSSLILGREFSGVSLRPLDCWHRGFESSWRHGYLSLGFVLCCEVCGLSDYLIPASEESYRLCVCVCVCACVFVFNRVWHKNFNNEAAQARFGLLCDKKTPFIVRNIMFILPDPIPLFLLLWPFWVYKHAHSNVTCDLEF
jgi:hypothetical protein